MSCYNSIRVKHRLLYIPILILFLLSFVQCAKKGTPSGGAKDTIPPVLLRAVPENFTTNFSEKEIRIYFDEYIKLKDLQKNLIISPPLKYQPIISPLSTSKYIKITLTDTLLENTTYSFNFGKSIVDNNEENSFDYYKYVFSTGAYIDSLTVSGKVEDVLLGKAETPTTVLMYEANEAFKDSLIFSEKPMYITTTRDSTNTFELTNVKEGNYILLALKDSNNDYIFQPKTDKIGFADNVISVPKDTSYTLRLFKEIPAYRLERPKHESKQHIIFGFEGVIDSLTIDLLSTVPSDFKSTMYKDPKSDTLHYWFKPAVAGDSLVFLAKNKTVVDTMTLRLKNLYKDSLTVNALNTGTQVPQDSLLLQTNTPLAALKLEEISVFNSDSISIPVTGRLNKRNNQIALFFPKTEEQTYTISVLPGAITDFYDKENDSLSYIVRTKAASDYGTLRLTVQNVPPQPIIVQLVNNKFQVVREWPLGEDHTVYFDYIPPAVYYIRLIYDENANGKWDTGSFLDRRQPEKVVYYPSPLEILVNWSLNETFTLE
ncbi:Ig-like domain-containing protein [Altibacter sp.]|uniref:Ig-like domain-containing protein n=1 Tax=Altibacter sp. TaxID=2024823 RepID=UPI002585628B|nr:Ig-like domain-containing protein [Altibacter sp.]